MGKDSARRSHARTIAQEGRSQEPEARSQKPEARSQKSPLPFWLLAPGFFLPLYSADDALSREIHTTAFRFRAVRGDLLRQSVHRNSGRLDSSGTSSRCGSDG